VNSLLSVESGFFENLPYLLPVSIISNWISTGYPVSLLGKYLIGADQELLSILSFLIILFQFSCSIPIFFKRYMFWWGGAIFIFHLLSYFVMGIFFSPSPLVALLFLCGPRYLPEEEIFSQ
jgi:hypothetical protein